MTHTDPVTDFDLCAYVDGQLDPLRRMEVEDHLSRHPDAAAAVMADLRTNHALGLMLGGNVAARPDSLALARRLDRRFTIRRVARLAPRAAFAGLAVLSLWLAQDEIQEALAPPVRASVPAFADEALDTHNTARLRQSLASETKDAVIDGAGIRKATQIIFPEPSKNWRILDSRLVPSDEGSGLQISFDKGDGVPITFFAVRTRDAAPLAPVSASLNGSTVVYWRKGAIGYALTGALPPADLVRLAQDLADNPVS